MFKVTRSNYDHDTVIHSASGFKCTCEETYYVDPRDEQECCALGRHLCDSCTEDATYWYASDDIYFCDAHKFEAEASDILLEV